MDLNSFYLNKKTCKDINDWIKNDFKKNFLFIHGKDFCGKTSLAECILKSYKIIHINIDINNLLYFYQKKSLIKFSKTTQNNLT